MARRLPKVCIPLMSTDAAQLNSLRRRRGHEATPAQTLRGPMTLR